MQNQQMIYGIRAIQESVEAGQELEKVLLQKGLQNELILGLQKTLHQHGIPFSKVPFEKLNKITRKNHQGAIAFISPIIYQSLDNVISSCYEQAKDPFILILDRITDVRNFGAIARSADGAGVDAILIPDKGSAQINSDAVKTSAGALSHIPVCRTPNLKESINYLKNSGLQIIACTEKADKFYYSENLTGPLAIIMGSEEDGISPAYLKLADREVAIPMLGKIASLNVSVSAAILLYEVVKQKQVK